MGCSETSEVMLEKTNERGVFFDEEISQFIEKSKSSTCKIIIDEDNYGSGFFCRIPYTKDEKSYLNVLLTCQHVLKKEIILSNDTDININILINNKPKIISFKKRRKRWSDENLDYSCIEIKEEDNIDNDYYQLDDLILQKDYDKNKFLEYNYNNITIFSIMQNKRGHSDGNILKFKDNFNFIHNCNTYPGSSGGVIVNKIKNTVIGMHIGALRYTKKESIQNVGIFIKDIIDDLQNTPFTENESDEVKNEREMNIIDEINIKYVYNEKAFNFENSHTYIRLFGKEFVENNKNLCKIIINEEENDLVQFYNFEKEKLEKRILDDEDKEDKKLEENEDEENKKLEDNEDEENKKLESKNLKKKE